MMFQASAPIRAPKITTWSTNCGSTVPLPMVAATLSWNTQSAAKLKKAANSTACLGVSAPVATMVEMELAPSWKPFMKSKASATSDQQRQRPES
jgi:hypothetical protein